MVPFESLRSLYSFAIHSSNGLIIVSFPRYWPKIAIFNTPAFIRRRR